MTENPIAPLTPVTHAVPDKSCDHCVGKGMPLSKSSHSFITLCLLAAVTVLGVMWINEKRKLDQITGQPVPVQEQKMVEKVNGAVPAPKVLTEIIELPKPILQGRMSLEATLQARRSRRAFSEEPVTLAELGQILWSAQGVTDSDKGYRTAPSAHSLYPFTLYVVVRNVEGLKPGLYQYLPDNHAIGSVGLANAGELLNTAGVQAGAQQAPVVIAMAASYNKFVEKGTADPVGTAKYEAGHIGQNIYLQVESLNMANVVMAGFDAKKVGEALRLDPAEDVLYLVPLGHRGQEVQE